MNEPAGMRPASTALAAEAFGTFLLVIAIVGVALFPVESVDDGLVGAVAFPAVAFAAGFAVAAAMYAFGPVSGGHFNPAVTIGLAAAGRFPWKRTIAYIVAQVIGGAFATTAVVLIGLFGPADWLQNAQDSGFASNGWAGLSPAGFDLGGAIVVELLFTAVFVMVYLSVRDRGHAALAGLVIGLTFTLAHLVTLPIDNTGVNPARSIATAIYGGPEALTQVWVFILFPLLGALLVGVAYRALFDAPSHRD